MTEYYYEDWIGNRYTVNVTYSNNHTESNKWVRGFTAPINEYRKRWR